MDDHFYPPRQVQGFYTKAELELMVKRRTGCKPFFDNGMPNSNLVINNEITNRHYQKSAITKLLQDFEPEHERKGLLLWRRVQVKSYRDHFVDLLVKTIKNIPPC